MRKAVSLFSGSLSSSLSTEISVNHCEIDRVILLTLRSPFFDHYEEIKDIANNLWPECKFRSKSIKRRTESIATSGRGELPEADSFCMRCRLNLLKTGGEFLDRVEGDFLVSGEAANLKGQYWTEKLQKIERGAGVEGLVFRPLSPNMNDSLPERKGWTPSDSDMDLRKEYSLQSLAEKLDLDTDNEYFGSNTRCKLTSPKYRKRLNDLVKEEGFNVNDLRLLDFGDYYKIPPDTKMVLAANPEEKRELHNYFLPRDLRFYLPTEKGPMGLVRSGWDGKSDEALEEVVDLAARITVAKSEVDGQMKVPVNYRFEHDNETYSLEVSPLESRKLTELSL
ncbi:MAG: hypothetical protein V5A87_00195 [Candidatus Bipolaricaulota bacterium]|nr:hypothetical protein [Candidatus Bipolaricaulota bacterium]MBS3791217.1 hypothetical protein [Candidatus Bipolaricaulota bacterium]